MRKRLAYSLRLALIPCLMSSSVSVPSGVRAAASGAAVSWTSQSLAGRLAAAYRSPGFKIAAAVCAGAAAGIVAARLSPDAAHMLKQHGVSFSILAPIVIGMARMAWNSPERADRRPIAFIPTEFERTVLPPLFQGLGRGADAVDALWRLIEPQPGQFDGVACRSIARFAVVAQRHQDSATRRAARALLRKIWALPPGTTLPATDGDEEIDLHNSIFNKLWSWTATGLAQPDYVRQVFAVAFGNNLQQATQSRDYVASGRKTLETLLRDGVQPELAGQLLTFLAATAQNIRAGHLMASPDDATYLESLRQTMSLHASPSASLGAGSDQQRDTPLEMPTVGQRYYRNAFRSKHGRQYVRLLAAGAIREPEMGEESGPSLVRYADYPRSKRHELLGAVGEPIERQDAYSG
ncbi:MAG TPA: hypothetical protein VMU17_01500, partial [Elusimicrobiota bacterium]|nr:hypothetical protein [Elusimicrobiota bacterium]